MNKILILALALFTYSNVNADDLTIATVNVQSIFANDQAKFENSQQMQGFLHARSVFMDKNKEYIDEMPVMGQAKKTTMQNELIKMKERLQQQQQALQVLLKLRRDNLSSEILQLTQQVSTKNNYDLVLNKSAVLYEKGITVDITPKVERLMQLRSTATDVGSAKVVDEIANKD